MMKLSEVGKGILQGWLLPDSFQWRLAAGADSALTFDDGPHPEYTPAILDLLAEHGIRATFFLIGERARQHPDLVRRIASSGHALGSHTQTHRELPTLDAKQLEWELDAGRQSIHDASGVDSRLMRPPRGLVDAKSIWRVHQLGFKMIHWSRTYSDYLADGMDPLLGRIRTTQLRPRDIVLFHDTNPHTAQALRVVIPEWTNAGRRFAVLQ